ncbi:NAD-dependent epimerase/dehydratase family protein [Microbulbifer sp. CAU 1566]|uniref:NAD-dependent epimerase/dehydratase family protein n=1 Tax=Microbulbifer sp. CAU 1566 TaxID=2933269 RepID=UPI002004A8D9|nr:NAD-dependent epimerase/dehydratase family protein [Microbulbifer sp. CAU 1566]MCK7597094.1 NAD-dependent epimerase/dehydratase family protein [Microbulbifer sp. CAU 1566]
MRWVIIGSSGYIGSALCRYLVQRGESVLSISRRLAGPEGCQHLQIGQFQGPAFTQAFQAGDRVVYAAGISSIRACRKNPAQAEALNCDLPVALLPIAAAAGAESFLYLSSVKALSPPSGLVAGENDGIPALDSYGQSKWRAEQRLLSAEYPCRVNILRPAAVYGDYLPEGGAVEGKVGKGSPGEDTQDASPAPSGKRAFLWKRRLTRWGRLLPWLPATGYRSFVALEDLLSAIILIEGGHRDGETFIAAEPGYYNLSLIGSAASGVCIKNSRLLGKILLFPFKLLSLVGIKAGVLEVERSELYSAGRLKSLLNWQPKRRYGQFLRGL